MPLYLKTGSVTVYYYYCNLVTIIVTYINDKLNIELKHEAKHRT